jgi:hypothetical protein
MDRLPTVPILVQRRVQDSNNAADWPSPSCGVRQRLFLIWKELAQGRKTLAGPAQLQKQQALELAGARHVVLRNRTLLSGMGA